MARSNKASCCSAENSPLGWGRCLLVIKSCESTNGNGTLKTHVVRPSRKELRSVVTIELELAMINANSNSQHSSCDVNSASLGTLCVQPNLFVKSLLRTPFLTDPAQGPQSLKRFLKVLLTKFLALPSLKSPDKIRS